MADHEKQADPEVVDRRSSHSHEVQDVRMTEEEALAAKPPGWMYKQFSIMGFKTAWYASPTFQLGMVSFVCFMCPGMFNALQGLGGGGKNDPHTADTMNICLYSAFAVFGIFGGSFVNWLGIKMTLAFGGLGYTLYGIALFVSVKTTKAAGFNIFAGLFLGICAGLLWTAQGTIMLSYPGEGAKGRYFAWFWGIFNMGGVIGALIPLGENINIKTNATVSDGTYIGFIILMFSGAVLALMLCNAKDVYRPDGTRVVLMKNPTWKTELIGSYETIRSEPYIILLFPLFFSSNWFTAYQFNAVNGAYFNTRTKALNNVMYWLFQIIGAGLFGVLMDLESVRRSVRAKINLVVIFLVTMAVWGGGYAFQKTYTRGSVDPEGGFVPMDFEDSGYGGPFVLYMFYGFYDALYQASAYWYMGALSNNSRKSANYVGYYKGLQSVGAVASWALDIKKTPFMHIFASNWGLLAGSLIIASPLVLRIKDHVDLEEDLKFSDETKEDVLPPGHPEKQAV